TINTVQIGDLEYVRRPFAAAPAVPRAATEQYLGAQGLQLVPVMGKCRLAVVPARQLVGNPFDFAAQPALFGANLIADDPQLAKHQAVVGYLLGTHLLQRGKRILR